MSIKVPSQSQIYGLILPCSQRGDYGVSSLNSNGFDGNKLTPEQLQYCCITALLYFWINFQFLTSLPLNHKDARIGKGDLRLKLMQKNAFRRAQSDDDQRHGDLREKLSKAVQRPSTGLDPRQRLPELKETGAMARIPSTRSADDLPHVDSLRNSYSPWTLDHLRRRSPDRVIVTSRALSPQRNPEELQRRPLNRAFDDVRSVPYMSKDVLDTARPANAAPFMSNPPLPPGSVKPVAPPPPHLSQLPPLSSIVQKSSYVVHATCLLLLAFIFWCIELKLKCSLFCG